MEGYGLSEGSCASVVNPLFGGPRKVGSIGREGKGEREMAKGGEGVGRGWREGAEGAGGGEGVARGWRGGGGSGEGLGRGWGGEKKRGKEEDKKNNFLLKEWLYQDKK